MTTEELVAKYIQLRQRKAELKAQYESQVSKLDEVQDKIEAVLLEQFAQQGVESVRTNAGTAYVTTRASASVADRDVFKTFLDQQEDPYTFIDLRVNKTAVEQFKAESGDLPPGVNWNEIRVVNFRRS